MKRMAIKSLVLYLAIFYISGTTPSVVREMLNVDPGNIVFAFVFSSFEVVIISFLCIVYVVPSMFSDLGSYYISFTYEYDGISKVMRALFSGKGRGLMIKNDTDSYLIVFPIGYMENVASDKKYMSIFLLSWLSIAATCRFSNTPWINNTYVDAALFMTVSYSASGLCWNYAIRKIMGNSIFAWGQSRYIKARHYYELGLEVTPNLSYVVDAVYLGKAGDFKSAVTMWNLKNNYRTFDPPLLPPSFGHGSERYSSQH